MGKHSRMFAFFIPNNIRSDFNFLHFGENQSFFDRLKAFFDLHSIAAEGKKDEKWVKKDDFLANGES